MNSAGKDRWDIQSHYNLSSGNSTLTSGAHTTSQSLGFSSPRMCTIFVDDLH